MVAWDKRKTADLLLLFNGIVLALVINQLAALYFFRLDLTEEKRYTIKQPTVELLKSLDDDVYVEVYLEGDLNAEFRRLRKAIQETLEEFRIYSGNRIRYQFIDPMVAAGENARQDFMADLVSKGINPINIIDNKDGRRMEKIVFPGALISFGGLQTGVMLLRDQVGGAQQDISRAIEGLEFSFANGIHELTVTDRKRVSFVMGHGELDSISIYGIRKSLADQYDVNLKASIRQRLTKADCDVLVVAKPTRRFTEGEKFVLDQYVMSGGNLILLLDAVRVDMDSVTTGDYYAFPYTLGLDDLLFKYGVRLNPDFVQDLLSLRYPIVTGQVDGKPQITPIEWPYFPLINQYASHPVTRNLDATVFRFGGSLDSVKATGIRKTPLMLTSRYSRQVTAPVKINVNDLRKEITPQNFATPSIPVAYLLEGSFRSLFERRFIPEGVDSAGRRDSGEPARIVVIADGDVVRNDINRRTGQPLDVGFDAVTGHTFANQELFTNLVAFLTDDAGLITARTNEIRTRPLDKEKISASRTFWQVANLGLPMLMLIALGGIKAYMRKRRFGNFETQGHGTTAN